MSSSNVTRIMVPVGDASQDQLSAQVRTIEQTYRRIGRRFAAWWRQLGKEERKGFLKVRRPVTLLGDCCMQV